MKKFLCLLLSCVILISLCSCSRIDENEYKQTTLDYFDTVCSVTAVDENSESFDLHYKEFEKLLKRYSQLFDIYNSYGNIVNLNKINKTAMKKPIKVNKDIIELLSYGKKIYALSDGKTNICLGAVLSIWHKYREEGKQLPKMEELKEAAKHTNINDLIIDEDNQTVFFKDDKLQLDVGAIAKGYAAKQLCEYSKQKLWNRAVISLGGNICTIGRKSSSADWNIAIENPDDKNANDYLCTLKINSKCVITSADNQRYYTVNGKRYSHIIDPDTLMPSEYFSSVSVICDDSALGDALSTTLFNMPLDEGIKLVEQIEGIEAVWVDKEYNNTYSTGFEEYII